MSVVFIVHRFVNNYPPCGVRVHPLIFVRIVALVCANSKYGLRRSTLKVSRLQYVAETFLPQCYLAQRSILRRRFVCAYKFTDILICFCKLLKTCEYHNTIEIKAKTNIIFFFFCIQILQVDLFVQRKDGERNTKQHEH